MYHKIATTSTIQTRIFSIDRKNKYKYLIDGLCNLRGMVRYGDETSCAHSVPSGEQLKIDFVVLSKQRDVIVNECAFLTVQTVFQNHIDYEYFWNELPLKWRLQRHEWNHPSSRYQQTSPHHYGTRRLNREKIMLPTTLCKKTTLVSPSRLYGT